VIPSLITTNQAVDPVFKFIFGASLLLLLAITATTVAFVVLYRRSRRPEPTSQTSDNIWLAITWTVLPTVLVMFMFYYGWSGYLSLRKVPTNALEVTATARMWSWSFAYANGKTDSKLYVPVGKPVLVNLVSQDVLHGFYLPAFRVKRDVVPRMKNYAWFVAEKPGSYDLFCSVYCGTAHSAMITTVEALPPAQFEAWLSEKGGPEHAGMELLEKHGCLGCHSLDGSPKVGPSFKGIWGSTVTVLTGGVERTVTVDEAFVRRKILEPTATVVKGFPPVMPSFAGKLTDAELTAIIDFLRTGGETRPKPDGAKLTKEKGCLACHSLDGSRGAGPSFKGLYNSRVTVLQNGTKLTVTADDAYLRKKIRTPSATLVEGYQPIMPALSELKDEEVEALVEFIKKIK
jgi:cytochrome c oxidase subunit 2